MDDDVLNKNILKKDFDFFLFIKENKKYITAIFSLLFLFSIYYFFIKAPSSFPKNSIFKIEKGEGLNKISNSLKENKIINSKILFQSLVIILGGENKIIAGDYLFKEKQNIFKIAFRIVNSDFGMKPIKVTLPEGLNIKEMSDILKNTLVYFNEKDFLEKSKNLEGYLFPDTYFFSPTASSDEIISKMNDNFKEKIKKFEESIKKSGQKEGDVIKMASILEGEAKDLESRRIVSGILWQRIKQKIPLQVDATFKYINGKDSFSLTLDDLKIKSPYNTYVNLGLPPTPINNPGEDAIYAVLNPIKTKYLYFLTGKDGKMYYAKTFEEHKINKEKYLR